MILYPAGFSVAVGSTQSIQVTAFPTNATVQTVTWTSSNASVATVSSGVVTGVATGVAVITATASDGSGTKNTATVTVTAAAYNP